MSNTATAVLADRIARGCVRVERVRCVLRVLPTAALLLALGCGGGQSTDDFIGGPRPPGKDNEQPSLECVPKRSPLSEDDAELGPAIAQLVGTHPIAGRWGTPSALLAHSPADAPFAGELVIEPLAGTSTRLSECMVGIEMPVRVTLRTDDGALDESGEGTALFYDNGGAVRVDGSPAPRVAHVQARFELSARPGGLSWDEDGDWIFDRAWLRAEVTPFGSRGSLQAPIERRVPPKLGPNETATSPPPSELLRWPVGDGCGGSEEGSQPLFAVSTAASAELTTAIEQLEQERYPAQYDDGTMTSVTVRIESSGPTCSSDGLSLPSVAHVQTEDGRLDLTVPITIDPGYAQLHFNSRTDVAWAYPPARLRERIGHIDLELDALAHVGIEAWFDRTPEPRGWVKVLGYDAGDCQLCDAGDGCIECSWERRIELLGLFIGAQIGQP